MELVDIIIDFLPLFMFASLAILLFSGYPVAFILGGLSLIYGFIGYAFDIFSIVEFFNFLPRIWGQAAENLVLVAVPTFVFMGVMMERSGVANDMLYVCQVLLKKVPGGLAVAVAVMGTVLAAMTGIIGASVTMMTALALPTMLKQGYKHELATGVICASGTLGILIPPSIMLIIMADLLSISVGDLFLAALVPGLFLAASYVIYIAVYAGIDKSIAPPLAAHELNVPRSEMPSLLVRSFLPPVFLIALIKGSILLGWATPSEAGAVGAFGATIIAYFNGRLNKGMVNAVCQSSGLTISFIFFIIVCATCFAYVFRSLGGDDVIEEVIRHANLGSWGLLFLIMAIVFILGFFLDWVEITLIILPVFAPMVALLDFGDHVPQENRATIYWFTVLIAINLQTSFLTPPFGYALFYLKGIAPREVDLMSIYRGIIPFVILQLIALLFVIMVPTMALWLPGLN
ncbi:MAG: TRAP transporter large permease subunit [Proteobacteria bacterium]|nr:TRAP transporter large permease subunit [Pseudomonadota bacterium]